MTGIPGQRDPEFPCADFKPGKPSYGHCDGDGHYLCDECVCRKGAEEMGLPHRRCANCRHFVHGSPSERDFWPTQHGHCYQRLHEDQGAPPYPAHANSRGCEMYAEKHSTRLTAEPDAMGGE